MSEIREFRSNGSGISRQPVPLRLAAVVVGVISGCGRQTRSDEERMRRRIEAIERDLIEPSILEHHGGLVKTTADGFVAIFDNPVEAVRCSIIIRQSMVERNQSLPKLPSIEYRIGVNLGDVIADPDDICGEGVHIATRLAAIAGPGQVCISGGIYEQIKHKLFYGYEPLGDRKVKNIAGPVTVYRMLPDPDAFHRIRRRREIFLVSLLSLTLLVIASGGIWYLFGQPNRKVVAAQAANHPDRARAVENVFQTDELARHSIVFRGREAEEISSVANSNDSTAFPVH
jgi:class 3 adenylate cyclase